MGVVFTILDKYLNGVPFGLLWLLWGFIWKTNALTMLPLQIR